MLTINYCISRKICLTDMILHIIEISGFYHVTLAQGVIKLLTFGCFATEPYNEGAVTPNKFEGQRNF